MDGFTSVDIHHYCQQTDCPRTCSLAPLEVLLVERYMKVLVFIGAIVLAVVMAALAAEVSHAHGSDFIEDENEGCAEEDAHYSVGRYVTYFYTAADHLHARPKSGVSSLTVSRITQNPFLYAGYRYDYFGEHYDDYVEYYEDIPDGYTGFKIEYTATQATGATVIFCFELIKDDKFQYQAGMFQPLRISGLPQGSQPGGGGQSGGGGQTGGGGQSGGGGQPGGGGQNSVDEPPTLSGDTTLAYAENATGPVATYTATDPENGQIVWSLSGTDGADFSIIRGDLSFNAGPDFEDPTDADNDNVYHVTVEASDGTNTVTLVVTVTVTNVNERPQFAGSSTARSAADGTGAGENIGAPVQATDPEGDQLTYSLGGRRCSLVRHCHLHRTADYQVRIRPGHEAQLLGDCVGPAMARIQTVTQTPPPTTPSTSLS